LLKENRKYGLLLKDIDFIISILSANPKIEKIVLLAHGPKEILIKDLTLILRSKVNN